MTLRKKLIAFGSALVATIALTAGLSGVQAQPYHHDRGYRSCHYQISRAEERLDRAIRRHGRHSYEARERRRELRHVRERCDGDRDHDRYRDRHSPY